MSISDFKNITNMKYANIEDFKKDTLGDDAYNKLVTEQITINEGVVYKKVEDMAFKDFDEFERLVNDGILDRFFRAYDYKGKKVPEKDLLVVKQALHKLMDEIIDIWDQTANESDNKSKINEEKIDVINQIPDVEKKYPKAFKFFNNVIMSSTFEKYYKNELMDLITGEEVESKKAEEALSWLEKQLKQI